MQTIPGPTHEQTTLTIIIKLLNCLGFSIFLNNLEWDINENLKLYIFKTNLVLQLRLHFIEIIKFDNKII